MKAFTKWSKSGIILILRKSDEMFKITINNQVLEREDKVLLEDLAKELGIKAYCAKVNNRLRELTYYVNYNCEVEFLDLTNFDAVRVYETSLNYVMLMALERLYPGLRVRISQCVSRSVCCNVIDKKVKVDNKFLDKLKQEMDRIIKANYPIKRKSVTKEEAKKIYEEEGYFDKIEVLKYREEDIVHMSECDGYINYLYGYQLPSTGYLDKFALRLYYPGFLIQFPRAECGGEIPPFEESLSFAKMLKDARDWSEMIGCASIASLNNYASEISMNDLVNICETKHNNMLSELGERIKQDIHNIRVICIAGPSSSGKTTFANRLRLELMSRGITPLRISMDDYYLDSSLCPVGEDGKPDFEHIKSLDLELFNDNLINLIEGEEVSLPVYDFEKHARVFNGKTKISSTTPIIIEGIHALNEEVTKLIPKNQKFKIYISPTSQINIDDHSIVNATDIRLLRRIVRDFRYRNTDPSRTFEMWPAVRRGEFRWIYPFQEEADYIYNSELTYELGVMKKYALPALQKIDTNDPNYIQANRLIKFLKYIRDIDEKYVPCNSLLREFIGGSCFYDV